MGSSDAGFRIYVVGISGAGKSTLSRALAAKLGVPHIELDGLFHGPDWSATPDDIFFERVAAAVAGGAWVVDGNYSRVRELVLSRATHVAWVDPPRAVVMWRVITRSLVRAATRRELWNGNRERWASLVTRDHPIRYAWRTLPHRRAQYGKLMSSDPRWSRLRNRREIECWLDRWS